MTVPAPRTVLVVDDDDDVRAYAIGVLEECGYRVLSAADGAAALEVLRDAAVDLLFTDVVMPGLGGIETARRARKRRPALKVLFTSGFAVGLRPDDRLLRKPYRPGQLTAEIAAVLAE